MKKNCDHYVVEAEHADAWQAARALLSERGVVALRGIFPERMIDDVADRVARVLAGPSLGGSVGYYRKDPHKRLYDPLLLGGPVVDLVTNERVFDFIEGYLDGECTLAEFNMKHDDGANELYFPLHADFAAGWRMGDYPVTLEQQHMADPIAVGAMIYLHDTVEGAFCYAEGTHLWGAPHGRSADKYPPQERRRINDALVRIEGHKGDLVLFDDRGFHGPEQPVSVSRTVLIFDYYKNAVFGGATKGAIPALINDLGRLNERQLRVLGVGAKAMEPYEAYHTHQFGTHKYYRMVSWIFEGLFFVERAKTRLRRAAASLLKLKRPTEPV